MNVKLLQGFQIYIATGTKGEPFDAAFVGWFADYADPYDFIDILLNGQNIHEANNNNLAYLNVPALNNQMKAANALTGDKRSAAYQSLDREITRSTPRGRRTRTATSASSCLPAPAATCSRPHTVPRT